MKHNTWEPDFAARFEQHEAELHAHYDELYHGDEHAWDYFRQMLYRTWQERSPALKALDEQRLRDRDWYRGNNLLGMLMYVKAFAGNLNGVRKRLDYIEDCGVNYLHLMPILESPKGRSDGGYAVADFRKIEPELGTMQDLEALA